MKMLKFLCLFSFLYISCTANEKTIEIPKPIEEVVYDQTGVLFPSYKGLVMAGYQGWFTAEGDGANRGWHHYQKNGKFEPGFSSIDFWPDVSEYSKTYPTAFKYANGE